jgi:hypothetical protein
MARDRADGGNSLVGSGHLDKAAIFSAAGDSTWASSAGFTVCLFPFAPTGRAAHVELLLKQTRSS